MLYLGSGIYNTVVYFKIRLDVRYTVRHCGLVVSAPAWDGTGREFDSWAVSDIYPMFMEPTITWVPSGFSGYIWLDTKIVLKKLYGSIPFYNVYKKQT